MHKTRNSKSFISTRPSLRLPVHAIACGALLLGSLGTASPSPKSTRAVAETPPPQSTVIFAVSGEDEADKNFDAVVVIQGGKFKQPYGDYNEVAQQKFTKEYFQPGSKYRLTFGGGEAGTAIIQKSDKGCNNIHATVAVQTTTRIHGQVRALATNSTLLGKGAGARRAPTTAERAAVLDLVKKIYAQHGVTAAQYRSMKVTNLAATDLDGDGKYEMVGSFALALKSKAERDLFLIAETQGAGMRASLAKFQAYHPPPEGFLSSIDFADQLDLDGDGIGEVFAVQGGFDGYGYVIFKKRAGRWVEIYSAMGDLC